MVAADRMIAYRMVNLMLMCRERMICISSSFVSVELRVDDGDDGDDDDDDDVHVVGPHVVPEDPFSSCQTRGGGAYSAIRLCSCISSSTQRQDSLPTSLTVHCM